MMSIQVAGGRDAALRVAKAVRLFIPVTSLGGELAGTSCNRRRA